MAPLREDLIKRVEDRGFVKSRPAHHGHLWRNPTNRKRVIIPDGPDIAQRNCEEILANAGYDQNEVSDIVKALVSEQK